MHSYVQTPDGWEDEFISDETDRLPENLAATIQSPIVSQALELKLRGCGFRVCRRLNDSYVAEILEAKDILCSKLSQLKIRYVKGDANFVLAYFGDNCKKVVEKLRKKDILVRDRSSDPLLDGFVRITIGTKKQMNLAAAAFEAIR